MTPKQRDRLERARRSTARHEAHPWLYAIPNGAVPVLVALVVNAADGFSVTRNVGAALFAGIVVLVLSRVLGPKASRRRAIRLARRYRNDGTVPSA
jgi:hypothetical protein